MKKIFIAVIILFCVFLIYIGYKDKKMYYFNIGVSEDYSLVLKENFNNQGILGNYVFYNSLNSYTTDIINDINNNVMINVNDTQKHMQNVLIKADLITLTIGKNNYINSDDLYSNFDKSLEDYEKLFELLRIYCKEKIVLIWITDNNSNFNDYTRSKMNNLVSKYDIDYVEISKNNNNFDKLLEIVK